MKDIQSLVNTVISRYTTCVEECTKETVWHMKKGITPEIIGKRVSEQVDRIIEKEGAFYG